MVVRLENSTPSSSGGEGSPSSLYTPDGFIDSGVLSACRGEEWPAMMTRKKKKQKELSQQKEVEDDHIALFLPVRTEAACTHSSTTTFHPLKNMKNHELRREGNKQINSLEIQQR